jgi:hypothetical protein
MTTKARRRQELLAWVRSQYARLSPRQFAKALSVKALPHDEIPFHHRRALSEFRRRTTAARIATCKRFEDSYKETAS